MDYVVIFAERMMNLSRDFSKCRWGKSTVTLNSSNTQGFQYAALAFSPPPRMHFFPFFFFLHLSTRPRLPLAGWRQYRLKVQSFGVLLLETDLQLLLPSLRLGKKGQGRANSAPERIFLRELRGEHTGGMAFNAQVDAEAEDLLAQFSSN